MKPPYVLSSIGALALFALTSCAPQESVTCSGFEELFELCVEVSPEYVPNEAIALKDSAGNAYVIPPLSNFQAVEGKPSPTVQQVEQILKDCENGDLVIEGGSAKNSSLHNIERIRAGTIKTPTQDNPVALTGTIEWLDKTCGTQQAR